MAIFYAIQNGNSSFFSFSTLSIFLEKVLYIYEYGLSYDDIIRQKFKLFIDSVAPRKYSYVEEYEREEAMEKERQTRY